MIIIILLIKILIIGVAVLLLIFGGLFVIGCIFGPGLDDAMQDREWRGNAAEAARRGK